MRRLAIDHIADQPLSHNADIFKRVIFAAGDLPHLTQLAQAAIPAGARVTPHTHPDMHEVFVVLEGTGRAVVDGIELTLSKGDCLQVEPGEPHSLHNPGPDILVLLYFGITR